MLSDQDKLRIEEEERYRLHVRQQLSPPPIPVSGPPRIPSTERSTSIGTVIIPFLLVLGLVAAWAMSLSPGERYKTQPGETARVTKHWVCAASVGDLGELEELMEQRKMAEAFARVLELKARFLQEGERIRLVSREGSVAEIEVGDRRCFSSSSIVP